MIYIPPRFIYWYVVLQARTSVQKKKCCYNDDLLLFFFFRFWTQFVPVTDLTLSECAELTIAPRDEPISQYSFMCKTQCAFMKYIRYRDLCIPICLVII